MTIDPAPCSSKTPDLTTTIGQDRNGWHYFAPVLLSELLSAGRGKQGAWRGLSRLRGYGKDSAP